MRITALLTVVCAGALFAQSYSVKAPASPKPYEVTAIKELTDYLAKRIDGRLTIGGASPVTFHVGDTELAKQHRLLSTELPDEEWHIKSVDGDVILNGGGTRGALYATYHFLEDYCGIHWWSDVEDHVPAASPLALEALDSKGKPMFIYRDIYRTNSSKPLTAIRNRMNRSGDVPVPPSLGGSFTYGLPYHCHTFEWYVSSEQYLKDHPEYFSLVKGKRVGGQYAGQLCLTNPDVRKIILERLLENIKKGEGDNNGDRTFAPRIYEVSMNDNWNRCECDSCKAEEQKYNPSGLYINFINYLAGEVKKKYPDVFVSTLAYFYTEEPPKGGVRAADNVVVKLCDTKTNEAASIREPENKVFYDFVSSWKGFAKNLFIWDYAITFTPNTNGIPFASEFHYGDTYRHYYENNVKGIFWEHEEPSKSDFYELKFFLETKLMEDPYQNVDGLIKTFMDCYYGAAAPYILEYRKAIDSDRKAAKGFVSWFPTMESFSFIADETILKSQALFDKAETAVAGDRRLSMRVRHARCGLDRLTCSRGSAVIHHSAAANVQKTTKFDVGAAARRQIDAWPEWCRQFPNGESAAEDARNAINAYVLVKAADDVPAQFKDREYYEYRAHFYDSHDRLHIKPEEDRESPVGMAMKVDVDASHYYNPPFAAGFYDQGTTTTILNTVLEVPKEPGYHFYYVGKTKIPENGYVFVTRAWRIKLQTGRKELKGNEYDIWISARFTGPKYMGDEKEKDAIYVDRILLVKP